MIQDKVSITFSGHRKEWDDFRLICKLRDTNASTELRHYINKFIDDNLELLLEYNENEAQIREMFINGDLD
jgi:hypothetical protein